MLDIRLIREDADSIKERVKTRGGDAWKLIDSILECDESRRGAETEKQKTAGRSKSDDQADRRPQERGQGHFRYRSRGS